MGGLETFSNGMFDTLPNGLKIQGDKLREVRFAGPLQLSSNPLFLIVHEGVLNRLGVNLDSHAKMLVMEELAEIEKTYPGQIIHNYDINQRLSKEQLLRTILLAGGFLEDSVLTAYNKLKNDGSDVYISQIGVLPTSALIF